MNLSLHFSQIKKKQGISAYIFRIIYLSVAIAIISFKCYSQSINDKGYFVPLHTGNVYQVPINLVSPVAQPDSAVIAGYNRILLSKVNASLYNLQDGSLGLQKRYTQLWGLDFYNELLKELQCLRNYLKMNKSILTCKYSYVPSPQEITDFEKKQLFTLKPDSLFNTKTQRVFNLIKYDLLADLLLKRYNSSLKNDTFSIQEMDINYVNDWRKLEKWFATATATKDAADKMADDVFNYNQQKVIELDNGLTAISPNGLPLAKAIKNSAFLKKWLWYSAAIPRINPLFIPDNDGQYPAGEKNSLMTSDMQKKQEELASQDPVGKFRTTAKYYNRLLVPVADADDKNKYFLLEYDRGPNAKPPHKIDENALDNQTKLRLAIYNIPNKDKLTFTSSEETLNFESGLVQKSEAALNDLGSIVTLASSGVTAAAKIAALLNNNALKPVQFQTEYPTSPVVAAGTRSFAGSQTLMSAYLERQSKSDTAAFQSYFKTKEKPLQSVYVNGQWVPLTVKDFDEDKRRIIWIGSVKTGTNTRDTPNPFFEQLLTAFINSDHYYFMDYDNIEPEVPKLQSRFRDFQKTVEQHLKNLKSLISNAESKLEIVEAYVKITDRSLPQKDLKAIADTVPEIKSILIYPKVPEAPKKLNFTLTEQSSLVTDKDTPRPIDNRTLNIIQTLRFDFSIGLSYTFPQYYIAQDAQPMPTIVLGDQFQFNAGLHYYFIDPLNRLHDNFFDNTNERFSVYAGLSIQHALDNYFLGLSYDLTPGVRLIGGYHFYKNYHYQIVNNSIADKASGINTAGFFLSLNFEPVIITKALGIFNSK